ncbi:MAG: FkbM family methyltransferase, partial [Actinomycetota bacterium]
WSWEVDAFPAEMALAASHVDEIWAPSEHAAASIRAAVDVPVYSFPHPVLVETGPEISRDDLELPEGFLFLFCFDFWSVFDRKNPLALIEAFSRAFEPGEGPRLVIKTVGGAEHPLDLDRLRLAADARPDVHVLDGYVTRAQTLAMIASCDAYVSLHRAEGFGLTMAEAMALGKPVVATGYSGNLEFMNEENAFLVPFELVPVAEGCEPYPTTARWAEPDVEAAAAILRRIWESPDDAREKGGRARGDIRRLHGPEARLPFVLGRLRAAAEERRRRQAERELPLVTSPLEHASTLTEKDADLDLPARYGFLSRFVRRSVRRAANLFLWHEKDIDRALIDAIRELHDRVGEVGRALDRLRSLDEDARRWDDELTRLSEMMADDTSRRALLRDELTELQARVSALADDPEKRTTVTVQTDVGPLRLPAYDRVIVPWMKHHGKWEPEVVERLRDWLAPGMVALDLGAHVGYHTILMSRLVGPEGRVIALEPEPVNLAQLKANLEAAGVANVDVHPVAALAESGSITLHLSDDNSGDHSISYRAGARTIEVPGVALDDLLGEETRIDVVKSDLQGADHLGLRGMERTLKRCRPKVIVEFWPEGIAAAGDDPPDVIRYYRSLGLSVRALEDGSLPIGAPPESFVEIAQSRREGFCTLILAPRP